MPTPSFVHLRTLAITAAIGAALTNPGSSGMAMAQETAPDGRPGNEAPDGGATPDGRQPGPRRGRTRSPQGIDDDTEGRRDAVLGPRREGRRPERQVTDGIEARTFDGTNNNLARPDLGATFSHLRRLGDAAYSDGVSSMIHTDRAGPREISNTIVSQQAGETIPNALGTSDFSWQWGQFIDHDIGLTDGNTAEPQDIPVPTGDPHFDPFGTGTAIIPFHRALYDADTGTGTANPREQENEITSWIDGSMIYGSDDARAAALRVGPDSPYLKTSAGNLLPFNTDGLANANGPVADPASLFLAGDVRVNEQLGLTALHTLFVREHNRLVDVLSARNPQAVPEALFQAARRLVVAELQIVTYEEHLPALIGPGAIPAYRGYDDSIDPTIRNEFSAAAYRLGHSMVNDELLRIGANGRSIDAGPVDLFRAFFAGPQLLRTENDIDPILRGLASQRHQSVDVKVIHTLRNLLFGAPGAGGLDLISLNIQRGRDHGLSSYNATRVAVGLPAARSFADITADLALQQSLQDAYGDVSKVDLWVGGLAETPLSAQRSHLGELFQEIVAR